MSGRRALAAAFTALVTAAVGATATASPVTDRLGKLARDLADGYGLKRPEGKGEPLAIFTFRCPPEMEKKQVGHAVAELLLRELAGAGRFTLVERTQMKQVLEEHALSLAGALDADSTVKVGRLLGAKLAAMGSVDTLGNQYQVNARLVDLESGEVLATAFQEIPREEFEAEARPYLSLVPDEQAIGIYLGLGWATTKVDRTTPLTVVNGQGASYTLTQKPATSGGGGAGIGLRYLVRRRLMLDASYWPIMYKSRMDGTVAGPAGVTELSPQYVKGSAGQLGLYWIHRLGLRFRSHAGAAVMYCSLDTPDGGGPPGPDRLKMVHLNPSVFRLEGGLEWRPRGRFGLAVTAFAAPWPTRDDAVFVTDSAVAAVLELPRFGARVTAGLYF